MSNYTKERRQEIVEEFARRHNGVYNPERFLDEVKTKGSEHPAYSWFQWDADRAANEHRLWQARCFAKDLRISFQVEEIGRNKSMQVRSIEMPMVISPTAGRNDGGGYVLTNAENADHRAEHCRQAATALRGWMRRYEAALIHVGSSAIAIEMIIKQLEAVQPTAAQQAAE